MPKNDDKLNLVMEVQMIAKVKYKTIGNMITSMTIVVLKFGRKFCCFVETSIKWLLNMTSILRPGGPVVDTMSLVAFQP